MLLNRNQKKSNSSNTSVAFLVNLGLENNVFLTRNSQLANYLKNITPLIYYILPLPFTFTLPW